MPDAGQNKQKKKSLPYFTRGTVIKGFGRGSKELGCPTANFPEDVVAELPADLIPGVYFGFGQISTTDDRNQVYKMVMSIGWNPFYSNQKKSMETHLLNQFETDFYGAELKIVILGYLRPEQNFSSLNELVEAIDNDIRQAKMELDKPENAEFETNPYFTS